MGVVRGQRKWGRWPGRPRRPSVFCRFLFRFRRCAGPVDRIAAGRTAQRSEKQPIPPRVAPRPELLDPDGHSVMPCPWLGEVWSRQPVPPWQVEAEIAVGLGRNDRVVDAVHVERDDQEPPHGIDTHRQVDVGMVDLRTRVQRNREDQHRDCGRAEGHHDGKLDRHRQQDFKGMKSKAGRDAEFEIGGVQPSKRRNGVEEDMLQVDGQIEGQNGDDDDDPARKVGPVQDVPAIVACDHGKPDRGDGKGEPDQKRVERDDAKVIRPAQKPGNFQAAARGGDPPRRPVRPARQGSPPDGSPVHDPEWFATSETLVSAYAHLKGARGWVTNHCPCCPRGL